MKFETTVTGNGTSLWGNSKGEFKIESFEIGYINWVDYPKEDRLHFSIDVFGPNLNWFQYTDESIEKSLRENDKFMEAIKKELREKLDENNIQRLIPNELYFSWSEQGLQPEKGWNFDCGTPMK